nr:probable LRR receptor-like serine/threonine-protein kinase At3g47570 [Malus domestica]
MLFSAVFVCCWSSLRSGLRGNVTDRLALLAIKAQIKQDLHNYNVMSSWNESTHFCMWHGVTCNRRHRQRVTKLDLQSQNLVGKLSPNVGNLSFLKELWLRNNSFSHEIPPQIGNLGRLQVLRLDINSFSSSIPHNISYCFNLIVVNFTRNKLVGKIPSEIGLLSKLQNFILEDNNITGQVPPSLGNLSSLRALILVSNNLMGNIPSSLGQLKKLTFLRLGLNQLSGSIPSSIYNLSSLVTFSMTNNQIQGSIPSDIGKSLLNLEIFNFGINQLTGSIPPSIINVTSVWFFDVGSSNLIGRVPNLQKLHNLQVFNIQYNNIGSGKDGDLSFLSDLTNATRLQFLIINTNNFGGTLPMSISNLSTKLEIFAVDTNQIYGSIPSGIGNLVSLEWLSLGNNSFTGNIPSDMGSLPPEVGNFHSLSELDLSDNMLSGELPSSLGGCESLEVLHLQGNFFNGSIPLSMSSFWVCVQGSLDDDDKAQLVAVKVFNLLRLGASKSFIAECEALRNIRHRNLVKIIIVCSSVDFNGNDVKALVYEFVDNGSLEEWLHPPTGTEELGDHVPKNLSLLQRLEIAIGVACALDYLHNHCETPIVHCDLKPSNVLLDKELTGHVSDFGLARFLS